MSLCGNCEPGALSMNTRVTLVSAFFVMFCACFVACWFLMDRYYKTFSSLALNVKADNCSRVNSTIHSIVIVPCLIIGVWMTEWGPSKEPLSSVAFLQVILCFVCAYFLCDTLVMVLYRVPLWGVYLAHHVFAVAPFLIYLFVSPCGYGLFLLSCFMLVEFSNFSLNSQAWMEQNGTANSKTYAACFYITFFGWIACRLVNPYLMVHYAHRDIYPSIPEGYKWCFIPSLCCGYLIVLFCSSVFIFVLCAALKKRWQSTNSWREIAQVNPENNGGASDSPMLTNSSDGGTATTTTTININNKKGVVVGGENEQRRNSVGSSKENEDGGKREDEDTTDKGYEGMASPTKAMGHTAAKAFDALAHAARERANSLGLGGAGGSGRVSRQSSIKRDEGGEGEKE